MKCFRNWNHPIFISWLCFLLSGYSMQYIKWRSVLNGQMVGDTLFIKEAEHVCLQALARPTVELAVAKTTLQGKFGIQLKSVDQDPSQLISAQCCNVWSVTTRKTNTRAKNDSRRMNNKRLTDSYVLCQKNGGKNEYLMCVCVSWSMGISIWQPLLFTYRVLPSP